MQALRNFDRVLARLIRVRYENEGTICGDVRNHIPSFGFSLTPRATAIWYSFVSQHRVSTIQSATAVVKTFKIRLQGGVVQLEDSPQNVSFDPTTIDIHVVIVAVFMV